MKRVYELEGEAFELECFNTITSRLICDAIMQGETYPSIPEVHDVSVVMDVGANCGAATVVLSKRYPAAKIFAFEPGSAPYRLLQTNTRRLDNVRTFNFGLHSTDQVVPLYMGAGDSATASIYRRANTVEKSELVVLRSVHNWLSEHSVTRVDVLKVDTEGCEVPILESMRPLLPSVKIVYAEHHSEKDRKTLDLLLGDTHVLAVGSTLWGTGEATYVAKGVLQTADPDLLSYSQMRKEGEHLFEGCADVVARDDTTSPRSGPTSD